MLSVFAFLFRFDKSLEIVGNLVRHGIHLRVLVNSVVRMDFLPAEFHPIDDIFRNIVNAVVFAIDVDDDATAFEVDCNVPIWVDFLFSRKGIGNNAGGATEIAAILVDLPNIPIVGHLKKTAVEPIGSIRGVNEEIVGFKNAGCKIAFVANGLTELLRKGGFSSSGDSTNQVNRGIRHHLHCSFLQ